jgi:hypothetical protein
MGAAMERRNQDRLACDVAAVCRVPATPCRARLLDVSRTGCRFRTLDGLAVPEGATVHFDLGPGRRVTGMVMWSGPRDAGVRFNRSLTSDMAILLGLEQAPVMQIETAEEDPLPAGPLAPIAHWIRRLLRRAA